MFVQRVAALLLALTLLSGCFGGSDDKVRHFAAGSLAAWGAEQLGAPPWAGCAAALGAGILKEQIDKNRGGRWDGDDVLATVAGCSVTIVF